MARNKIVTLLTEMAVTGGLEPYPESGAAGGSPTEEECLRMADELEAKNAGVPAGSPPPEDAEALYAAVVEAIRELDATAARPARLERRLSARMIADAASGKLQPPLVPATVPPPAAGGGVHPEYAEAMYETVLAAIKQVAVAPDRYAKLLNSLDAALATIPDPFEKAERILDAALEVVGGGPGYNIDLVVRDPASNPLRVVARRGPGVWSMPQWVPGDLGITRRALDARTPDLVTVVPNTAVSDDFRTLLSSPTVTLARYGEDCDHGYRDYLARVGSAVMIPLGRPVRGLIRLTCDTPRQYPPDQVQALQLLADRADAVLATLPQPEPVAAVAVEPDGWLRVARERIASICPAPARGDQAQLAPRSPRGAGAIGRLTKLKQLARELAEFALGQVGAYRAAVRLLTPDGEHLAVLGHAGVWDPAFLETPTSLGEPGAATTAVRTRRSVYIDTARGDVIHKPIGPTPAETVAAILLAHAGQVVGVLSVDWDRPGAITEARRLRLEALCVAYVTGLQAHLTNVLFAELDRALADLHDKLVGPRRAPVQPDYGSLLELIATMVGVKQGEIFVRRSLRNRFHLAASLTYPDWAGEHWYEPGDGLTGWVLAHDRPLRLADMADEKELAAIDPHDPPVWLDKYEHHRNSTAGPDGEDNRTFLGVPVSYGSEVLGVIRLTHSPKGFGSYEEQVVKAAARRLARLLHDEETARRQTELLRLAQAALKAESAAALGERVRATLRNGLGTDIAVALRLAGTARVDGHPDRVLVMTGVQDRPLGALPLARRVGEPGSGSGLAAQRKAPVWHRSPTPPVARGATPPIGEIVKDMFAESAFLPLFLEDEPARSEVIGVLSVYRREPFDTQAERAFIQSVAALAGPALVAASRVELAAAEREIRRAVTDYLTRVLWGEGGIEDGLLDRLARVVAGRLGDDAAWSAWRHRGPAGYERTGAAATTAIPEPIVAPAMSDDALVIVFDQDPAVNTLFAAAGERPPEHPCGRAVVRLQADGQPAGLLLFQFGRSMALGIGMLREAVRLLSEMAGVAIVLGRQFEGAAIPSEPDRQRVRNLLRTVIGAPDV